RGDSAEQARCHATSRLSSRSSRSPAGNVRLAGHKPPASGTAGECLRQRHGPVAVRSEEHTSELQSRFELVCRLLLEKKNRITAFQLHTPPSIRLTHDVATHARTGSPFELADCAYDSSAGPSHCTDSSSTPAPAPPST